MGRIPIRPASPERICWGCEKYCPADDLACGNGTIRTPHPCELFGDDWLEWERERRRQRWCQIRFDNHGVNSGSCGA